MGIRRKEDQGIPLTSFQGTSENSTVGSLQQSSVSEPRAGEFPERRARVAISNSGKMSGIMRI